MILPLKVVTISHIRRVFSLLVLIFVVVVPFKDLVSLNLFRVVSKERISSQKLVTSTDNAISVVFQEMLKSDLVV